LSVEQVGRAPVYFPSKVVMRVKEVATPAMQEKQVVMGYNLMGYISAQE